METVSVFNTDKISDRINKIYEAAKQKELRFIYNHIQENVFKKLEEYIINGAIYITLESQDGRDFVLDNHLSEDAEEIQDHLEEADADIIFDIEMYVFTSEEIMKHVNWRVTELEKKFNKKIDVGYVGSRW